MILYDGKFDYGEIHFVFQILKLCYNDIIIRRTRFEIMCTQTRMNEKNI